MHKNTDHLQNRHNRHHCYSLVRLLALAAALACGAAGAQTAAPVNGAKLADDADSISQLPLKKSALDADTPTLILADGGRYYGPLKDGLLDGEGRIVWREDNHYVGHFVRGRMHGHGKTTAAYGVMEGEYRDGLLNGKGHATNNGTTYEGDFVDGFPDGQGRMTNGLGQRFEGQFKSGQFTGRGSMHQPNGMVTTGKFDQFKPVGVMVVKHPNGMQFTGEMDGERPKGVGELRLPNGIRVRGDFNQAMDKGELIYPNGDHYTGDLAMHEAHGNGELRHANGDVYRGAFSRGRPHGAGALTPAKGSKTRLQQGQWLNGRYVGANASTAEAAEDDSPAQAARNAQRALYVQNTLLATQMAALQQSDPKAVELYALFVAGDGTQEVFRREVEYVASQFGQRFDTAGRSMVLANSRTAVSRLPLATEASIERALNALAQRMDREQDLLFVFLTSHGSPEHDLQIGMRGMRLPQLSAQRLGELLKASGITKRVVVVSACYSGGFIEPLKSPTSWVITAARADRTSFGCADENDFTYFGRALFKESLPRAANLTAAFTQAKQLVAVWEGKLMRGEDPHAPESGNAGAKAADKATEGNVQEAAVPAAAQTAGGASDDGGGAARSEPQMAVEPTFQREVDAWFAQRLAMPVNVPQAPQAARP